METLLLYPLKTSALLLLFFAAYHLLLKKETFFTANRLFLLAGLVTSTLLPLVEYTKVIWVTSNPAAVLTPAQIAYLALALKKQAAQPPVEEPFNWWYVIAALYLLGFIFFVTSLFTDIFKIRKMLKGNEVVKQTPYKLVDSPGVDSPFSFFNYIVYNSGALAPQELESIISHEKVHSRQKHSIDMLLSQAYCILFWFNPIAWLYKKAIAQNLEFIADAEAMKQVADKTAYQKTMLRLAVQVQSTSIINHFYQSLIKKRIVMLNTKKSRRRNSWKYAAVMPLLAFFVMAFQVKTVAQEKETAKNRQEKQLDNMHLQLEINKDFSDEQIEQQKKLFAEIGAELSINNITRNKKGEITGIKVSVKGNGHEQTYNVNSTDPIEPFIVAAQQKNGKLIGVTTYKGTKTLPKDTVEATAVIEAPAAPEDNITVPQPPAVPNPMVLSNAIALNQNPDGNTVAMNISDNTIVLVNGIKQPKGAPVKIPAGQEISSVNVLRGKDAKKKYGKDAKDGAIEITTEKKRADKIGYNIARVPNGSRFAISLPEGEINANHFEFNGDLADGLEGFGDISQLDLSELEKLGDLQISLDIQNIDSDAINALTERAARLAERAGRQAERAGRLAEREKQRTIVIKRKAERAERNHDSEELRKELEEAKKQLEEARKQLKKQAEKNKSEAKKKS